MDTPIKQDQTKDAVTFYEICMDGDSPLTGSITGECADLREELDAMERKHQALKFNAKVRKRDLQKLLLESHESQDEWVSVRLNLSPRPDKH